jgi:hypothetical protein
MLKDIPKPDPVPEGLTLKLEFQYLKKKFQERPIWLKNSLLFLAQSIMKFESYHIFKKYFTLVLITTRMLSFMAYSFKDGPWKHAYVRFGYDPRGDVLSFENQVIDVGVLDSSYKYENIIQSHKKNELYEIISLILPVRLMIQHSQNHRPS